jgi:hypothetical protein
MDVGISTVDTSPTQYTYIGNLKQTKEELL